MVNLRGIDSDDISVGSLAFIEVEKGRKKKQQKSDSGKLSRRSSSFNEDDDSDDDDNFSLSHNGELGRLSRSVTRTRNVMLILLIVSGIFLAVGALFLETDESEDADDDSPDGDSEDSDSATSTGIYSTVIGVIYAIQFIVFLRYDFLVTRRQGVVVELAEQSKSIVDSLFPSVVRDRLMQQSEGGSSHGERNSALDASEYSNGKQDLDWKELTKQNTLSNKRGSEKTVEKKGKTTVGNFLAQGGKPAKSSGVADRLDRPNAEHYPDSTVLFLDIAGFTAWSSTREPQQVFQLLETVYAAFDEIADLLGVFKVETIGDSYMAVTGVPKVDHDHHLTMAKFAWQCVKKMDLVTESLEAELGSDTKDLGVRVGMHSGPVTAGVLRGQKARYQLFGDTVNTASRMESTGEKGRIQVSQETADLLIASGKSHWIRPREDKILAKGKGELSTYWLDPADRNKSEVHVDDEETSVHAGPEFDIAIPSDIQITPKSKGVAYLVQSPPKVATSPESELPAKSPRRLISASQRNLRILSPLRTAMEKKGTRYVDMTTDILFKYLESVMFSASPVTSRSSRPVDYATESHDLPPPIDLIADVVILPKYNPIPIRCDPPSADVLVQAKAELQTFLADISVLYNDVPFHNFEHASHVTLATDKLIEKMVKSTALNSADLHLRSFGISSDPLSQFALVLAAVIHDVGHIGVPNAQLVDEEDPVASQFKNQSVAEQNSIVVAWELLLEPRFMHLRSCIYRTNIERKRFRQVLINSVLATDIADRKLHIQRKDRRDWAFPKKKADASNNDMHRKATVAMENLIQMADVSPTMQSYDLYRLWNDRLFEEMLKAYQNGRAHFDPAETWYKGELGFFDHYVIPLAKFMKRTGVFGNKTGERFVVNATENRNTWKETGEGVLKAKVMLNKPQQWATDDVEESFAGEAS